MYSDVVNCILICQFRRSYGFRLRNALESSLNFYSNIIHSSKLFAKADNPIRKKKAYIKNLIYFNKKTKFDLLHLKKKAHECGPVKEPAIANVINTNYASFARVSNFT